MHAGIFLVLYSQPYPYQLHLKAPGCFLSTLRFKGSLDCCLALPPTPLPAPRASDAPVLLPGLRNPGLKARRNARPARHPAGTVGAPSARGGCAGNRIPRRAQSLWRPWSGPSDEWAPDRRRSSQCSSSALKYAPGGFGGGGQVERGFHNRVNALRQPDVLKILRGRAGAECPAGLPGRCPRWPGLSSGAE